MGIDNNTLHSSSTQQHNSSNSTSQHESDDDNNRHLITPTKLSEYQNYDDTSTLHRLNKRNVVNESAASRFPPPTTPSTTTPLRTDAYRAKPNVEISTNKASTIATNGGRKISVLVHNVTTWSEDERRNGNNEATPKK